MIKRMSAVRALLLGSTVSTAAMAAQAASGPAGHWEGSLQVPGQELKIQVDLSGGGTKWEGTITIPEQKVKGLPLSAIAVQGNTVSFAMRDVPGNPQFKGTLSQDGKSLSGDFTQGGGTIPFALTRTGDARIEPTPKSTPITRDVEGSWDGALNVDGTVLRLTLKLSNQPEGATGSLISVDQGGAEIPVAAIVQSGMKLTLMVRAIAGTYEGELKNGQLTGTWTQGSRSFPLVFTRPK